YGIVEVHSVSHSLPMSDAPRACGRHWQGQAAVPFRAESSSNKFERIRPENLANACHTLLGHPWAETSDWQEIRTYRGTAYRRSKILVLHP
ncbi:hypothetical protein, partial [uncultured Bacteroides sp.]|uniref:hypothetical protein n=1 Tax=uncultured Bacteroides sp. TaxID=162156 RepID=UPI00266ECC4E